MTNKEFVLNVLELAMREVLIDIRRIKATDFDNEEAYLNYLKQLQQSVAKFQEAIAWVNRKDYSVGPY